MGRYDNLTFNSGEYIPQYAGLPLDEIQKSADTLAGRHYQNLASLNQLQLLREQYKSKMLPGAKSYVDEQFGDIDLALQDMAKSGGENATAKVSALTNRFLGDQGILRSMETAKGYEEFKKTRDSLTAQGLDPVWNKKMEQEYLNAKVMGEDGQLNPLLNTPFNLTPEKRLNYMEKQDEVLAPMQPDSWQNDLKVAKGLAGVPNVSDSEFLESTAFKGLTSKKVQQYLFGESVNPITGKKVQGLGWTSYKDSPEYRQQKMTGMSDEDIKAELMSRGEAKVFSQMSKDFIRNPDPAQGSGNTTTEAPTVTTVAPAMVREDSTWKKVDGVTKGGVKKSFIASGIDMLGVLGEEFMNELTGKGTPEESKKLNQRKSDILNGRNIDVEKTNQALDSFRTALEVAGYEKTVPSNPMGSEPSSISGRQPGSRVSPENMTKTELLELLSSPEGNAIIKQYQDQYETTRYSMPMMEIPVDEGARQANEDFMRGTFFDRQIMDDQGNVYSSMRDEKGAIRKDLQGLHQAFVKKEAIYNGRFTPQNLFTQKEGAGKNFTRGLQVTVPNEDGTDSRTFYLSELPGVTGASDVNENIMWNKATVRPGAETDLGQGITVKALVTPQQKAQTFKKHGAKWAMDHGLTESQFMSGQGVLIKLGDEIIPFASYTAAAAYLAKQGIELQ